MLHIAVVPIDLLRRSIASHCFTLLHIASSYRTSFPTTKNLPLSVWYAQVDRVTS